MTQAPRGTPGDLAAPGRNRFTRSVSWNIAGNVSGKLLGPLFQILIARLLLPEDFGAFAIAVAWLAVFEIGKDWGISHAIVVRRGAGPEISLQFTIQLITALAFYAITLVFTPFLSAVFDLPSLMIALPLVGCIAFISAVSDPVITGCLMAQNYRRLAFRQTVMPFVTGAIGLVLAYRGWGAYSLPVGLLSGHAAGALALAAGEGASLRFNLDMRLARDLMRMGKHLVLQRLLGYLVTHADSFIVGRTLGPQALGLYRVGNLLAFLIPAASIPHVQQVVFTELSAKSDAGSIRSHYNQFTHTAGFLLLIYSIAIYFAAPPLVPAVLGEQWQAAVPMIQVFSVVVVTGFVTPLNVDLAKILGFIGSYTYFAAGRAICTVIALIWAAQFSTMHVVIAWVIVGFASNLMNDVLFYCKQDVVGVTPTKIALTGASWMWASFVILSVP